MSAAHKGEWVLFSRFVKCQMRFLNKTRAFFALRMPPNLKWIPIHLSSELCSWASNVYANALHSHCELWSMRHLHTHITLSPTHFWQNAHTGPNELCRNNLTSSGDIISVAFHLQSASRRSSRWMKNALIIIRHYECVRVCVQNNTAPLLIFMMLGFGVKKWIMHATARWNILRFWTLIFSRFTNDANLAARYIKRISTYRHFSVLLWSVYIHVCV